MSGPHISAEEMLAVLSVPAMVYRHSKKAGSGERMKERALDSNEPASPPC